MSKLTLDNFVVLDLRSQAFAVKMLLNKKSVEEKLMWLSKWGMVAPVLLTNHGSAPAIYSFESRVGLQCAFFFNDGEWVFVADHTTYSV